MVTKQELRHFQANRTRQKELKWENVRDQATTQENIFEKFDSHSEFVHALSSKQYPTKEETKNRDAITLGMSVKINSNTRLRKYIYIYIYIYDKVWAKFVWKSFGLLVLCLTLTPAPGVHFWQGYYSIAGKNI